MRVTNSSWVISARPIPSNIPSNTRRIVPICRFQTPPNCDVYGRLNIHSQTSSATTELVSGPSNWDFSPTKIEPRAPLSFVTGPRMVKNRRTAQMNELPSMVFSTWMWMVRQLRKVKIGPQCFALALPPLTLLVEISRETKTSFCSNALSLSVFPSGNSRSSERSFIGATVEV